jgi:uncharacterized protein with PIN domain
MSAAVAFVADVMLGRLARELRRVGLDVVYSNTADDADIVRTAEREGRVILTRDSGLCRRRTSARCVLVKSGDYREQFDQVMAAFDLRDLDEFSRCLECNTRLVPVDRSEVRDRLPSFVYETQQSFASCPTCARVYWQGTHVANMRARARTRS